MAGFTTIVQKNFNGSGDLFTNHPPKTHICGVMVDVAGTVIITDYIKNADGTFTANTANPRIKMVFGAPGYVGFNEGSVVLDNGGTLTLTGVTNCSLTMGY